MVQNKQIEEIKSELEGLGSGEYTHVADWIGILVENGNTLPDIVSSLEELKSAADAAISKLIRLR